MPEMCIVGWPRWTIKPEYLNCPCGRPVIQTSNPRWLARTLLRFDISNASILEEPATPPRSTAGPSEARGKPASETVAIKKSWHLLFKRIQTCLWPGLILVVATQGALARQRVMLTMKICCGFLGGLPASIVIPMGCEAPCIHGKVGD